VNDVLPETFYTVKGRVRGQAMAITTADPGMERGLCCTR
jgi:hypothetical protein